MPEDLSELASTLVKANFQANRIERVALGAFFPLVEDLGFHGNRVTEVTNFFINKKEKPMELTQVFRLTMQCLPMFLLSFR